MALGSLSVICSPKIHAVPTTSFDPSRIIDDGVFYNSSSMNVAQIQQFLNSKVPVCDTWGTQSISGVTRAVYSRARGHRIPMTCMKDYYENPTTLANNLTTTDGQLAPIPEGAQSAAQIIYTAAAYYSINPQVLVVLLQKEQGLVVDDWPWEGQYRTATGYGCPDTAPCNSQYFGFYNQVNRAAAQFRNYASYPNSFNYIPGPGNYVQFNPSSTCGGATLNIQNQATASLYDYTPYQPNTPALAAGYGTGDTCSAYGNRNFWLYFNDWFGSTLFKQPIGGSLLYQGSTGKIYLTNDTTRFYISSWDILVNYGLDIFPLQTVSDATVQQYTDGGILTNLAYDANGVYLINNRIRHHVSGAMCTAWGLSCFDNTTVKQLGITFATTHLTQGIELTQLAISNSIIYEMKNGQKSPILNPKTLQDLGYTNMSIIPMSTVNSGQPLGQLLVTTPGIIKFKGNTNSFYFDGTTYYIAPNVDTYNDWSFNSLQQWTAPASSYDLTPPTSIPLSPWYIDSNGNKSIIDKGRVIEIPKNIESAWSNKTFSTSQPLSQLNALPHITLQQYISSNGVYQLFEGKMRHIPSYASYVALGVTDSQVTVLSLDKTNQIPVGNDALGDGLLIAFSNDNQGVYVILNSKITKIPDYNTLIAYNFNLNDILVYPPTILNDYPLASTPISNVYSNNTYYIVGTNALYAIPAIQAANFGIIGASFTSVNTHVIKLARLNSLSRFMYNTDTGKIYYASGDAIHFVATYSAFVAYGGMRIPASPINSTSKSLFTETQTVY